MVTKESILLSLQRRLPKFIEKHIDLIEYAQQRYKEDPSHWDFLVSQLWDLGQLYLANNEIDKAKKCFAEGVNITLNGNRIREDILPMTRGEYETPLKAYLGCIEAGKIYSNDHIPTDVTFKKIDDYIRVYKSWHYGLYGLILGNDCQVQLVIDFLEEKTKDFKLGADGMPPSITHTRGSLAYTVYYMKMLKSILRNDSEEFSRNLDLSSRLRSKLLSQSDNPMALISLGLVVLYDMALSRGLRPNVETPFIPEDIIKNGYWFKPKLDCTPFSGHVEQRPKVEKHDAKTS